MKNKILIVDDMEMNRQVLTLLLEMELKGNYEIHYAENALEATRKIELHDYRLILSDLDMPSGDGYYLLRYMKANNNPTPVVIITGSFEVVDNELLKNSKRVIYRIKDLASELREVVKECAPI